MTRAAVTLAVLVATALTLVACGGDDGTLEQSSATADETTTPPGSAIPSSLAATLTPSPSRSPPSASTSPRCTPTRSRTRRPSGSPAPRASTASCTAAVQRTLIIVAHRLSTVVDSDRIVVLDQGRVVAIGPHDVLLDTSPLYRELATHQLLVPQ